jgi:signal transduction histidine kinase
MVAVMVLLGVVVVGEISAYQTAHATTGSVALALRVQDLVQELQQERGLTSGLLGGDVGFKPEIEPERKKVDASRAELAGLAGGGARGSAGVQSALAQLDGLTAVRDLVDAGKASRASAFEFFTDRIAALNGVDFGLDRSPDPTLRRGVSALAALGDVKEYTAQERAALNGVFSAGGFKKGEYPQFAGMHAHQQEALARYNRYATPDQRARNDIVQDTGAAREALDFEQRALDAADGRLLQVDPQSWWSALTTVMDGTRDVQQSVGTDIRQRAQILETGTTRRLAVLGGLVLLCLIGALGLMVAAARSVTGPLNALAAEADAVATQRLPDAVNRVQTGSDEEQPQPPPPVRVPARASWEIQSVAAALDRVQATAYALATEQALLRRNTTESLANLGRRNQNLLRRQLGFISRLESEENDPSGLANLFELDHLATRMRRNAESLLVLVGEGSPRRWSEPMPVADIIRAAISEVEEYRRVTLRRIDDAFVVGSCVTGLAHMVAELVENGLAFSPPDQDVEIQGRFVGNQYLVAITDQGVGMDPAEMARSNARLRGEEHFLLAPARFLGHYVVGQLARQMSIDVQLSPSPVIGVTARVTLPPAVLANPAAIAATEIAMPPSDRPAPPSSAPPGQPVPEEPNWFAPTPTTPVPAQHPVVPVPSDSAPPRVPAPVSAQLAIGVHPVEYVTVPGPDQPAAAMTGAAAGPQRTRNGLLKRPPRTTGGQAPAASASEQRGERPPVVDDSPDQTAARLMSLRAGVQRGQSERTGE